MLVRDIVSVQHLMSLSNIFRCMLDRDTKVLVRDIFVQQLREIGDVGQGHKNVVGGHFVACGFRDVAQGHFSCNNSVSC